MPLNLSWQPSASIDNLAKRAKIISAIRNFFDSKQVLAVETPLLCQTTATSPYIASFTLEYKQHTYYLQTSPEHAMKRLLAAGSGPIYQITKAFRQDPCSAFHNCEFTILEWYRPDFDHHQLMDEVAALLTLVLNSPTPKRITYQALFAEFLGINPHTASLKALIECTRDLNLQESLTRDEYLQVLMAYYIEPHLGVHEPVFVYDFPSSQAELARIIDHPEYHYPVAARFEVYYRGIELANGFYELHDAAEQKQRQQHDIATRAQQKLPLVPLDERLLGALAHGLPRCSGVAVGLDRLIMLALACSTINEVLSFAFSNA